MYRQVFVPNQKTHSITIPREWYGQEIEVIAFPTQQQPPYQVSVEEMRRDADRAIAEDEAGLGYTTDEVMEIVSRNWKTKEVAV